MRAIRVRDARHASVDTGVVLTGETRHAIVGIIATGDRSKAPTDFEIARIVGISAIAIGRARATWSHFATLQIIASGLDAVLAWRADLALVAELFFFGAPQAERVGAATRPRIETSVATAVRTSIQIDTRVAPRVWGRGGIGITTASRRRNGQQHASKESHGQGAAGQPRLSSLALLPADRTLPLTARTDGPRLALCLHWTTLCLPSSARVDRAR